MIDIFLRGHIRNSFATCDLLNAMQHFVKSYGCRIFIRTWNTLEASSSWRRLKPPPNNDSVSLQLIENYFKPISNKIIIQAIDTETSAHEMLVGDLQGYVANTLCPKIPWKRMWAQKYSGIQNLYYKSDAKWIINTRFDVFRLNGKFRFTFEKMDNMIREILDENHNWEFDERTIGVDNFYIGRKFNMLAHHAEFHHRLDSILTRHPVIRPAHQELLTKKIALEKYNDHP